MPLLQLIRRLRTAVKIRYSRFQSAVMDLSIARVVERRLKFRRARKRFLSSAKWSVAEKAMLRRISLRVHPHDDMYIRGQEEHYLSVGLSASVCIGAALKAIARDGTTVRSLLDFPCGYGRELRFLKAKFPQASITAGELNTGALEFCGRTFAVSIVQSAKEFPAIVLSDKFDLIWCGSLITHLEERNSLELLKFFCGHLAPGGLCLFSTHGQNVVDEIVKDTIRLTADDKQELLSGFYAGGYGYVDYFKDSSGYGTSVVSRDRMVALAQEAGPWKEVFYLARGWAESHDVYGFALAGEMH